MEHDMVHWNLCVLCVFFATKGEPAAHIFSFLWHFLNYSNQINIEKLSLQPVYITLQCILLDLLSTPLLWANVSCLKLGQKSPEIIAFNWLMKLIHVPNYLENHGITFILEKKPQFALARAYIIIIMKPKLDLSFPNVLNIKHRNSWFFQFMLSTTVIECWPKHRWPVLDAMREGILHRHRWRNKAEGCTTKGV